MQAPGAFGVAPLTPALLADPIAFLSAEHARQMALLSHLERLARAPTARGARVMAAVLLRWMVEDLALHRDDEAASLHPRLLPHDAAGMLARLATTERRDAEQAEACLPGLRAIAAGRRADDGFPAQAAAFAQLHRERLGFVESRLMPLAQRVITGDALRALATEMAARRGMTGAVPCPTEA